MSAFVESRNIQHSTSNTERSISEASSGRLDVERSMLNVECCRFMERTLASRGAAWQIGSFTVFAACHSKGSA
jgi:hypothetical protein